MSQKEFKPLLPLVKRIPQRLYQIDNPPCMLYVKGTLPNLDEQPALAVVGTEMQQLRANKLLMT